MAEAPSEVPLPATWGQAWLDPPGSPQRPHTVRAYTADGWRLSWNPGRPGPAGCDIERPGDPPLAVARRLGASGDAFWPAWVQAEACAKATDTPILAWLDEHGSRTPRELEVHAAQLHAGGPLRVAFARKTNP